MLLGVAVGRGQRRHGKQIKRRGGRRRRRGGGGKGGPQPGGGAWADRCIRPSPARSGRTGPDHSGVHLQTLPALQPTRMRRRCRRGGAGLPSTGGALRPAEPRPAPRPARAQGGKGGPPQDPPRHPTPTPSPLHARQKNNAAAAHGRRAARSSRGRRTFHRLPSARTAPSVWRHRRDAGAR